MKATLKDLELELWLRRRGMREIKWQMQNWREIPINDMDETQLVNAIERLQYEERKTADNGNQHF